ncbi:MAG: L,D-transpeptidase/peptidoglycan binding protein [Eubacterium sp.]|nr:L,D-transpeptidase/peptidoglycan binding protein [Eubacterium sp.]
MREITPDNYKPDEEEIVEEVEEAFEEELENEETSDHADDPVEDEIESAEDPEETSEAADVPSDEATEIDETAVETADEDGDGSDPLPDVKKKKKGLIALLVTAIVVVGVYLTGFIIFQTALFMPKTTMNQVDVSMKTDKDAEALLTSDVESYALTIEERNDQTEVLKGVDFGVQAKLDDKVKTALASQKSGLWFVEVFKDKEIHVDDIAVYDVDALNEVIPTLNCLDESQMIPSENATISETMTDGAFTIVDEVYGTEAIPDNVYAAINEAVAGMEPSVNLADKGCYYDPELKADSPEAQAALEEVNDIACMTITYEMAGTDPYLIDGNVIRQWIDVSDDLEVTFDEEYVTDFVDAFAEEYDTSFTEREFVNHAGETVTVPGGYFGWQLDKKAEEELLLEELEEKEDVTREPCWKHTAISLGEHEYGDKYVEVDLTRQTVYLMEDGEVAWESPCVTGKTSRRHGTTPGMYSIYIKQRNRTLNGRNDDGSEYHSPVAYWMPFNGGQGLHDARWRGKFGGSIYVYSGSHGCVNLPTSAAAELYDMVEVGTPVIVYWSNTEED